MEFIIDDYSLHYYEPPKKDLVLLNTISKNKEGFRKREIKSAAKYRDIQHTLLFTTVKEVKWIIRSNHIQECPVEKKDVENTKKNIVKICDLYKRENDQEETHLSDWGSHKSPQGIFKNQQKCITDDGYIFRE